MDYCDKKHYAEFEKATRRKNKKDYLLMAALYLLTADHRLWLQTEYHTEKTTINYECIRLRDIHPAGYILYGCAKDLYSGTKHLSVADLADPELIPLKQFALICNAMAIRRFDISAINKKESENNMARILQSLSEHRRMPST